MSVHLCYYLDEHIPPAVEEGLQHRGVAVRTVKGAEMLGASDKEHLAFARKKNYVLVTHDDDFLRLAAEGISHSGIVYIPRERSIGETIRGLRGLADVFVEEEKDDRIEFL